MTKLSPKIPIAVLASGRGSNLEALCDAIQSGSLGAEIVAVVSDQSDAPVLAKARERGILAFPVPLPAQASQLDVEMRRRLHEEEILRMLKPYSPRFLVLAGYMRIMTSHLIDSFRSERGYSRIVNVHPSLLPAFSGTDGYAQAFRYGCQIAGVTIHLVDLTLDGGPICAQEAFSIVDCRTEEEVERKGLAVEHRLFSSTLRWVLPEKFDIEVRGPQRLRRLCVRPH